MNKLPTHTLWWWLATWLGSGLSPKASGTAGSLAALPFAFIIQYYVGSAALFTVAVAIFLLGCWASKEYMKYFPDNHDPKQIVIDEVAGMWLVLAALVPNPHDTDTLWMLYIVSFALFRFFDAAKPFPISWADRNIKGAFGVMFDDVLAAICSIITYLAGLAIYLKFL